MRLEPVERPVAAILAGGLGTRLAAALPGRPKALAPVLGRPILRHLLDRLEAGGIERAVICTGWRGDEVEATIGTRHGRIALVYSREPIPLGTGGALRRALPLLDSSIVVICNGDSLVALDLSSILPVGCAERSGGACEASLVVAPVPDASRFGTVELRGSVVARFAPAAAPQGAGTPRPGLVSAGILVVPRSWIGEIPAARSVGAPGSTTESAAISLEADILPGWVARGLGAIVAEQGFLDVGTPASLAAAGEWLRTHPVARPAPDAPAAHGVAPSIHSPATERAA